MKANSFVLPTYQRVTEILKQINSLLKKFAGILSIDSERISVSVSHLVEIILQVEMDKNRIAIFHNNSHISEIRESSLYCYYFLRKRPIAVSEDFKYTTQINELFCIYLLLSTISIDCKARGKKEPYHMITEEYFKSVLYIFSNGELSRDALYLLADTIRTFC